MAKVNKDYERIMKIEDTFKAKLDKYKGTDAFQHMETLKQQAEKEVNREQDTL